MPTFKFAVTETRNYEMEYTVEADSLQEAESKAERGETTSETEVGCSGVSDRFVAEALSDETDADGSPDQTAWLAAYSRG